MKQKKGKKPGLKRLVQGYLLFTAAYMALIPALPCCRALAFRLWYLSALLVWLILAGRALALLFRLRRWKELRRQRNRPGG